MTFNAVKTLLQDSVSNAKKDEDGKKEHKTEIKVGRGRRTKRKRRKLGLLCIFKSGYNWVFLQSAVIPHILHISIADQLYVF